MHRIATIIAALLLTVTTATAKREAKQVYMFGFAASFTDTIVHITNIQQVDSAWIDNKGFLLGRERYSQQLKYYLADSLAMPHRTCAVFYATERKDIDKQFARITKLYYMGRDGQRHYDVRRLEPTQFTFSAVDMSEEPVEVDEQQATPPAKDKSKKKSKKNKKKRDQ